jgi:NAD-dependent SIR2 family protein deacetylase
VKRRGGLLIEVNPNDTELSGLCDLILRVPSGLALPQLVEEVRRRLAAS